MADVSSFVAACAVDGCPDERALWAPLCEPHMVECWRWVEARPAVRPTSPGSPSFDLASQMAAELNADTPDHPRVQRVVYYLQLPHGDVKIGVTADLPTRCTGLRLDYPNCLLAAEPGGYDLEAARHAQFETERRRARNGRRTEDFDPSDRLRAHIEAVLARCGEPETVVAWQAEQNSGYARDHAERRHEERKARQRDAAAQRRARARSL